jgi:hypothetical protein
LLPQQIATVHVGNGERVLHGLPRRDCDSYQLVLPSTDPEASGSQPIADIVAIAASTMEAYAQTPGKATGVFEFLTERQKQQESRPLPQIPPFNPCSQSSIESSSQEDLALEPSPYIRVQEFSSISRIPRYTGDKSSVFDPTASPTPIVGNSRVPQRIDLRWTKASLDDRLLRNTTQADQENTNRFTAVPSREHRQKSSYTDTDLL